MQDSQTDVRRGQSAQPTGPGRLGQRQWSRHPHHRRRRALALGGLAVALLVILLQAGGGQGRHRAARAPQTGFFTRLSMLAGTGPGSLAGRVVAAQNAAIDRTLSYTPYVRVAGAQHRELALTFDDGPGPYTPAVLSVLGRYRVPATFFELGFMEAYFHDSTTAIVGRGDAVGDHTFTHAAMSRLSGKGQRIQLLAAARELERYGAGFPRLFRPPYGLWNDTTLAILRRYRMLMVLWTVETADYRRPGVPAIVQAALSGARPGAIILLHDAGGDRGETVAALPRIITALRAKGYRFATVPQLLVDNPPPRDQQLGKLPSGSGA